MRHRKRKTQLNRTSSHRMAMLANMAVSLIDHEQIKTTLPKARMLKPYIEKLITVGKKSIKKENSLFARRNIISKIRSKVATAKLLNDIAPRYEKRLGGYTRIVRAGFRYGDMAPVAYIQLIKD